MSGKGSKPRPFSISQQEYDTRWDAIFQRDLREEDDARNEDEAFETLERINNLNNTGTHKNEYYDVLSTEDCLVNEVSKQN